MRRFADRDGGEWEVVAGRESWGAIVALFIPTTDGVEIRQAPLNASGHEAAAAELDRMSDDDLRELLERSDPKTL